MTEKPIIFSTEMVKAILDGTKTQTRRVIKPQPSEEEVAFWKRYIQDARAKWWRKAKTYGGTILMKCPYGQAGDRLWVRETFRPTGNDSIYLFTDEHILLNTNKQQEAWLINHYDKNMPSIHMPRWASRITLEITEVRAERLQEIGEKGAGAEGFGNSESPKLYCMGFHRYWDFLNASGYGWAANPFVWCISFRKVLGN